MQKNLSCTFSQAKGIILFEGALALVVFISCKSFAHCYLLIDTIFGAQNQKCSKCGKCFFFPKLHYFVNQEARYGDLKEKGNILHSSATIKCFLCWMFPFINSVKQSQNVFL